LLIFFPAEGRMKSFHLPLVRQEFVADYPADEKILSLRVLRTLAVQSLISEQCSFYQSMSL
jgi:hypothetical protein